jgi:hypothetical protein
MTISLIWSKHIDVRQPRCSFSKLSEHDTVAGKYEVAVVDDLPHAHKEIGLCGCGLHLCVKLSKENYQYAIETPSAWPPRAPVHGSLGLHG